MGTLDILYSQKSLTKQINMIKAPEPFVLSKVFKNKERHATETIAIEIINGYSDVAKFADQYQSEPHIIGKTSKTVKEVTVPRTYEAKVFSAQELNDISKLGSITNMSSQEKKTMIAEYLDRQLQHGKDRVLRLREKIAIEALSTGKITVSQSDLKFKLNFGFVANKQKETLTGDNTWDTTNTDDDYNAPIGNQVHEFKKKCPGASMMILDPEASKYFRGNINVQKELDTNNLKVGNLDLTQVQSEAVVPLGKYRGLDVYEYIQTYDSGGSDVSMLGENKAILINPNKNFTTHFAPVYRIEGRDLKMHMSEFYVKPITDQDGFLLRWHIEQKSLPAIFDLSGVYSVTVK